jgi:hypothetical protein
MGLGNGLKTFFEYSRWIALLTCLFFVFSVLDNVPDCPELLNQKSLASTSAHFSCHFDHAVIPGSLEASCVVLSELPVNAHLVMGVRDLLPASDASSLPLAADSSPPLG